MLFMLSSIFTNNFVYFLRPLAVARIEAAQGKDLFDLDALDLDFGHGQAHPGDFGVGVGHAWNHAGVEGAGGKLFISLQLTGNHLGGRLRLLRRFVRQHGGPRCRR